MEQRFLAQDTVGLQVFMSVQVLVPSLQSRVTKQWTNTYQGQVFYQSTNASLAFLFFKCSYASGICVNYGEHIISSNVTTPVSPNTSLAAALFSKDIGYRVTYQDIHGSIRQLAYANNTQGIVTNWADGNFTGNLTVPDGGAIATTYVSPSNVTGIREVLYAVGEGEVKSSKAVVENKTNSIHDQKVWIESTSPLSSKSAI